MATITRSLSLLSSSLLLVTAVIVVVCIAFTSNVPVVLVQGFDHAVRLPNTKLGRTGSRRYGYGVGAQGSKEAKRRKNRLVLTMSEPSDTSGDDFYNDSVSDNNDSSVVTVESQSYEPTPTEAMVTNVMDLIPQQSELQLGVVTTETRAAINEALIQLESSNPTKSDPALSPLVNGVWELRYVGGYTAPDWVTLPGPTKQLASLLFSGGYSPGVYALSLAQQIPSSLVDVSDLEITISRSQPRIEASVRVKFLDGKGDGIGGSGSDPTIRVMANLDAISGVRMSETYESIEVFGRPVSIPKQLQYSRDLYVTYVDDDLMIVRDSSGIPEVLVRKDKTFVSQNWGTDPPLSE